MLDYSKIRFRDNLPEPNEYEMNCTQFCGVYLMDKLGVDKVVWPVVCCPLGWYKGQKNILIESFLKFLELNKDVFVLKKIYLHPPFPDDDTIVISRARGSAFLHHAGVYTEGKVLHCLSGGVRVSLPDFKQGSIGFKVIKNGIY